MMSCTISRQIHLQWVKAEVFNDSLPTNISCNIIRQTVVTAVHGDESVHKQEVADLIVHSLKTTWQSYWLRRMIHTVSDVNILTRKHFDGGDVSTVKMLANGDGEFSNETPTTFDDNEAVTPPAKGKPGRTVPLTTTPNSKKTKKRKYSNKYEKPLPGNVFKKEVDKYFRQSISFERFK